MIRDGRGMVASVFLLILIPFIVIGMLSINKHAQIVFNYDIDFQQAVSDSVRAAAFSIDPLSQASANPMIKANEAHEVFRKMLAKNLNLNESDLTPKSGSSLRAAPSYQLVVFNGENTFGLEKGVVYPGAITFSGELPQDFVISESGIMAGSSGDIVTTLDRPGCIAVIKCSVESFNGDETTGIRWAAAKVVK